MKEVILVGASYCGSCHAMREWFFTIELPNITLRYDDIEKSENDGISSLPTVIFKESGTECQRITGAINKADFINKIHSIWPETKE